MSRARSPGFWREARGAVTGGKRNPVRDAGYGSEDVGRHRGPTAGEGSQ